MQPRDARAASRRCYSVSDLVALGVGSRTTIWRLRRDGLLRFRRVGRRVLVMQDDLDEFLESSRSDS